MGDPVSSTELEILDLLWREAPKSIRDITEILYEDVSPKYYATVQSLLLRLERKDWIERDRSARQHLFSPKRPRSEFIGEQIQDVANAVCGGSVAALLGQLAGSSRLTDADRDELRRLVDEDEAR